MMTGTAIRIAANRVKCPFFNVGGELVPLLDRLKKSPHRFQFFDRFDSSRVVSGLGWKRFENVHRHFTTHPWRRRALFFLLAE